MTRPTASLLILLAGCSVDRSALEDRVFECASDSECASGYVCQIVDAAGGGFCAPQSAPDGCEGVSTMDEACLAECSVESAEGCREGEECQRTDVLGEAGVCLATQTCSDDSDCGGGPNDRCLSSYVLDQPNSFVLDHLSCVRGECDPDLNGVDDDDVCLENQVCAGATWTGIWGGVKSMCLPKCGDGGTCPPGFGCLAYRGEDYGPYIPGLPGMTCRQDLDCLAGKCEEYANGDLRCRVACEDDGLVGCGGEIRLTDGRLNRVACSEGSCVVRDYLSACTSDAACGPGFGCREVTFFGDAYDGCVLPCDNPLFGGGCPIDAFCTWPAVGVGGCVRKFLDGFPCYADYWCVSDFCDLTTKCAEDPPGCCAPSQ